MSGVEWLGQLLAVGFCSLLFGRWGAAGSLLGAATVIAFNYLN